MKFLNEGMKAVVILVCEKHAPTLVEKLNNCREGNWFVMPPTSSCRIGYTPHVSDAHAGKGLAIMGFAENKALSQEIKNFAAVNPDGSQCSECVAYHWDVTPTHVASTSHDVVCGRSVTCDDAASTNHNGEIFFFCSVGCRDRFVKAPDQFLSTRNGAGAGTLR